MIKLIYFLILPEECKTYIISNMNNSYSNTELLSLTIQKKKKK